MQQVKFFKSVDTELEDLERTVNRWIRKTGVRVLSIQGNLSSQSGSSGSGMNTFAAGDVLVVVHYEIDKPSS